MNTSNAYDEWKEVIEHRRSVFNIDLREIWQYRHLLRMFVRRDIVSLYAQTILGPFWFVMQPILTTFIFTLVFGRFSGLSSDGQPQILFYFSGVILWSFFNDSFLKISSVLKSNAGMLRKVYFPRLILPITTIVSSFIRLIIQFAVFLIILFYFIWSMEVGPRPNLFIFFVPLLILIISLCSLGAGMLMAALTIHYRDLVFLITFGVTLLMYITPVIYPLSAVPPAYKMIVTLNPMSGVIEGFRHAFLGSGAWTWSAIGYSFLSSLFLFFIGLLAFNKAQRNFIDRI